MEPVLSILAVPVSTVAVCVVLSAARPLWRTTLFTAWCWGLAFSVALLSMEMLESVFGVLPRNWSEILWYVTAITGVCASIAVLGARRPVNRVWNLFVILPLLAVLGWPVMIVLLNGSSPERLHLDAPPLVAFGLVLLMGYGNYVGTRYGWCAVLAAAGEVLLVAPLAVASRLDAGTLRTLGLICMSAGTILAAVLASRQITTSGLDRVWSDFRNSFGIVWSRRIMERFNQQAQQEHWGVRLGAGGFAWGDPADQQRDRPGAERFLRWLLRRFVDDEWFDSRVGASRS